MAEEAKVDTQETTETAPETTEETKVEPAKVPEKETVGEALETNPKPPDVVGLDKFLEIKKDNKALREDIAKLQKSVEEGATKQEVSADINSIADEYGVDKGFLGKLTAAIQAKAEAKAAEKLKPFEERERKEKIDAAFNKHFKESMERMPEYEGIVNPDVIKAMSLNPANADKTFDQIIEESYSSAIQGRRTIETTTPGGGKSPEPIDYRKASTDNAYLNEILANPATRAEYNKDLEKRLRL